MPSRKRALGKARKAARAQAEAKHEEEDQKRNAPRLVQHDEDEMVMEEDKE